MLNDKMPQQSKSARCGRVFTSCVLLFVLLCNAGCGGSSNSGASDSHSSASASQSSVPAPDLGEAPAVEQERIAWGENPTQFADLYRPTEHSGLLPVIIMVHGGCWSAAYGLEFQADLARTMAERGFAVWNIEYRRLGNGGEWPVMFTDVAAAADYLPSIAEAYQLDTGAVTVIGHSAGGHLALWLASRGQIPPGNVLYKPSPLAVEGVISLAGIGDLTSRACGESARTIVNQRAINPEQYQARLAIASPIEMLPTGVSSLLLSGSRDSIVPSNLADAYVDAAQLAGDNSEHMVIAGADHFDLIDPMFMDITLLEDTLNGFMAP